MFIQNFSYYVHASHLEKSLNSVSQAYFAMVPSKHEATFEYAFRPDKSLRPMELRVALTMFYGDSEGQLYGSTFFNETIDIVEKPALIDYEMVWMWIVMLALAGAAGSLSHFCSLSIKCEIYCTQYTVSCRGWAE